MANSTGRAVLWGLFVAVAIGSAAAATRDGDKEPSGTAMSASSHMHMNMMKGMKEMPKPTGDMDRDFATMMRHHHQQGIQMSQMELQHGKDAKMREMAQKIIDAQKQEIAEFDKWLNDKSATKK